MQMFVIRMSNQPTNSFLYLQPIIISASQDTNAIKRPHLILLTSCIPVVIFLPGEVLSSCFRNQLKLQYPQTTFSGIKTAYKNTPSIQRAPECTVSSKQQQDVAILQLHLKTDHLSRRCDECVALQGINFIILLWHCHMLCIYQLFTNSSLLIVSFPMNSEYLCHTNLSWKLVSLVGKALPQTLQVRNSLIPNPTQHV